MSVVFVLSAVRVITFPNREREGGFFNYNSWSAVIARIVTQPLRSVRLVSTSVRTSCLDEGNCRRPAVILDSEPLSVSQLFSRVCGWLASRAARFCCDGRRSRARDRPEITKRPLSVARSIIVAVFVFYFRPVKPPVQPRQLLKKILLSHVLRTYF